MALPDFLIIGEQKCGSTTLWAMLREHPGVFFPDEKELHYWASYPQWSPIGRFGSTSLDAYAEQFAPAGDRLAGEATPNYLFDPGACERIAEHLPGVRAIAILRDPVERAWSHYWHQVRRDEERLSFEAAIAAEAARLAEGGPEAMESMSYTTRGHYVRSLERWWGALGRDRVLVTCLDDLKADPDGVINRVTEFLGLPPMAGGARRGAPQRNRASYPKYPRLNRLARSARRSVESLGGPWARAAAQLAKRTQQWRVYSGQPRMNAAVRHRLDSLYEPSDRQLADELQRPLPWRDPHHLQAQGGAA
ncbi:MAG: sulfotransferase [Planctomycetota bacterium]